MYKIKTAINILYDIYYKHDNKNIINHNNNWFECNGFFIFLQNNNVDLHEIKHHIKRNITLVGYDSGGEIVVKLLNNLSNTGIIFGGNNCFKHEINSENIFHIIRKTDIVPIFDLYFLNENHNCDIILIDRTRHRHLDPKRAKKLIPIIILKAGFSIINKHIEHQVSSYLHDIDLQKF